MVTLDSDVWFPFCKQMTISVMFTPSGHFESYSGSRRISCFVGRGPVLTLNFTSLVWLTGIIVGCLPTLMTPSQSVWSPPCTKWISTIALFFNSQLKGRHHCWCHVWLLCQTLHLCCCSIKEAIHYALLPN